MKSLDSLQTVGVCMFNYNYLSTPGNKLVVDVAENTLTMSSLSQKVQFSIVEEG